MPVERTVVRVRYAKQGRLRALSHLETKTAIERSLRRARLPMAYSQGFSPKPKMTFSPALSVGIESRAEYVDLTLVGVHDAESIGASLKAQMPPGLDFISAEVAPTDPLNQGASAVTYTAEVPTEVAATIDEAIGRFMASTEWFVTRKYDGREKQIDLKRFVRDLKAESGSLRMELIQGNDGGARPAEVVQSLLGIEPKRLVKQSVKLGLVS
jgi:radical SAM-linked protein